MPLLCWLGDVCRPEVNPDSGSGWRLVSAIGQNCVIFDVVREKACRWLSPELLTQMLGNVAVVRGDMTCLARFMCLIDKLATKCDAMHEFLFRHYVKVNAICHVAVKICLGLINLLLFHIYVVLSA